MTADEYKRLAAAEATIDAIRTALGGYPDSDLVSLATTLNARNEWLEAENERLTAWIIEADAAFNSDGQPAANLDECAGLVRMCHEGRAAIDEAARLSDRVKGLTGALELARAFVVKAHVDGAYSNTTMTGDTALRIINEALAE